MEIYGWEIALGIIALALAISFVVGIINKLRGGTLLPEDTFLDQRREADRLLKEINKRLGFPEGTGPTGVMVDGQYRVVDVGHTERMKKDPVYAFGNEMAGIMMDTNDLENALKEAQASNNTALARSITNELQALERRANALMDKHQRERGSRS